ncbi:MAG: hypothetical protein AAF787_13420 [Chloroflexota bacterium]
MQIGVADADGSVVVIIEYAAGRYGATTSTVDNEDDLLHVCPDVLFVETRHRLYDANVLDMLRASCAVPVFVVAMDTMAGFDDAPVLADFVLPKPFTAADLKQLMDQLSAV